jgi:hypothetical protein
VNDRELMELRLSAQLAALRGEQMALPPQIVLQLLNKLLRRPWED